MEQGISFIIANRSGKDLDKVIKNINEVYNDINKEILIIEQYDNKPFLRGQLFNIGVKYANMKYIALSDNDMFHLRKVPWIDIYENVKKPLIGFKYISQISFKNGLPIITSSENCERGFGGFNFMAKDDFINFNGFSNLYIGWGYEDNAYSTRFSWVRIPQNLGHLTHPIRQNLFSKNREYNKQLMKNEKQRNKLLDGYKQTIFSLVEDKMINSVRYIKVNNITVTEDFIYKNILNNQYKLLKG